MTRINTNVASLVGQNTLGRSNASLNQALTRLSTGLRINTGKDDPAGLIASENLRSDITSIRRAISNTDRANQVIATADSALGQVSTLLNDIRGLVTESANSGALSQEQIDANQLQVDSSLEALNRIAQTTTFQGRRLLDGSLDFITTAGSNFSKLSDLKIDQANLGSVGQVSLDINVSSAATRAGVSIGDIAASTPASASTGSITFSDSALAATGDVTFDIETAAAVPATGSVGFTIETADSVQATGSFDTTAQGSVQLNGETINLEAGASGAAGNAAVTSLVVNFGQGADDSTFAAGTLTVNVIAAEGVADIDDVITAIGTGSGLTATLAAGSTGTTTFDETTNGDVTAATLTDIQGGGQIDLTAIVDNTADGVAGNDAATIIAVNFGAGQDNAVFSTGPNTLTVNVTAAEDVATLDDVLTSISNGVDGAAGGGDADFSATLAAGTGTDTIRSGFEPATVNLGGGVDATFDNTQTIDITTIADGGQNFNLQITTAAAASIADADAGDGITAGIVGDATTGYTVQVANDAAVNLTALATFIQTNIGNVASATYSGAPADVLDLRRGEDVAPAGANAINGSTAATVATQTIQVTASQAAGAAGNVDLNFVLANVVGASTSLSGDAETGYTITIDTDGPVLFTDIEAQIANIAEIDTANYTGNPATTFDPLNDAAGQGNATLTGGRDAGDDVITITALTAGNEFDGAVNFNTGNTTIGDIAVTYAGGEVTVSVDSTSSYSLSDIADAITDQLADFSATVAPTDGSGTFDANDGDDNTAPVTIDLAGGQAAAGGISADAVIELSGSLGSEVFNLQAGTSVAELVKQINLVSDATGVQATSSLGGTQLELASTTYGSSAFVDLKVSGEEDGGTFGTAIGGEGVSVREEGTDVVAAVNGVAATGNGNELSINTATLDLTTTVEENFSGNIEFDITGGGALFQLGPDVVSNQQARLGINSVNTAALGGVSGSLFQLNKGGTADLSTDTTQAARIVEEAIDQITSLRGRLGAFQRTTLETNQQALNDTLTNLTAAESSIRDADFAVESAALTRAQILVQSGTNVLSIANQNPQNVLALLR